MLKSSTTEVTGQLKRGRYPSLLQTIYLVVLILLKWKDVTAHYEETGLDRSCGREANDTPLTDEPNWIELRHKNGTYYRANMDMTKVDKYSEIKCEGKIVCMRSNGAAYDGTYSSRECVPPHYCTSITMCSISQVCYDVEDTTTCEMYLQRGERVCEDERVPCSFIDLCRRKNNDAHELINMECELSKARALVERPCRQGHRDGDLTTVIENCISPYAASDCVYTNWDDVCTDCRVVDISTNVDIYATARPRFHLHHLCDNRHVGRNSKTLYGAPNGGNECYRHAERIVLQSGATVTTLESLAYYDNTYNNVDVATLWMYNKSVKGRTEFDGVPKSNFVCNSACECNTLPGNRYYIDCETSVFLDVLVNLTPARAPASNIGPRRLDGWEPKFRWNNGCTISKYN